MTPPAPAPAPTHTDSTAAMTAALTFALAPSLYALLRIAMLKLSPEVSPLAALSTERSAFIDRCTLTGYVLVLVSAGLFAFAKKFPHRTNSALIGVVALSTILSLVQGALFP